MLEGSGVPEDAVPTLMAYISAGATISVVQSRELGRTIAVAARLSETVPPVPEVLADSGEQLSVGAAILELERLLEAM